MPPEHVAGVWCGCARRRCRRPWTPRNRRAPVDRCASRGVARARRGCGCRTALRGPWLRSHSADTVGGVRGARDRRSGGELLAALTAAACEDRTSGAGRHPQTEAVGLGPPTVVRLEGALAHDVLRLSRSLEPIEVGRPPQRGGTRHVRPSTSLVTARGPDGLACGSVTGMRHRPGWKTKSLRYGSARNRVKRASLRTDTVHRLWITMWT